MEFDIGITQLGGHMTLVAARQFEHIVIHIDADNAALGTDDLGGDIADLAAART